MLCQIKVSGNFCLWNPESWALESGKQLKESGIPLMIVIWNSKFLPKNGQESNNA